MPDSLKATDLRLILIGILILLIGAHIGLTVYGQKLLLSNSDDVTDAVTQAQISQTTLSNLKESKRQLDTQRDTFERSKDILASAASDNYQREIIEQVTSYARIAGVTVTGFTFQSQNGSSASTPGEGGVATPTPTTPSPTPAEGGGAAPASAATPQSVTVTLDLKTPIDYPVFLSFIQLLQNNVTQFKVEILSLSATGVGEAASTEASGDNQSTSTAPRGTSLSIPTITMEIYTK